MGHLVGRMTGILKVSLGEQHFHPGKTKHTLIDAKGARSFGLFTSLVIATYPDASGYYLLHLCADGTGTDTYHTTLEEAFQQAEWEFGVQRSEWVETNDSL